MTDAGLFFFGGFFFVVFAPQNRGPHGAVHQAVLQGILHRHPQEAVAQHQVLLRPLPRHQREARQAGAWHLERHDWRGNPPLNFSNCSK